MSEPEIELEKRQPAAATILILVIVALTVALVGFAGYFVSKGDRAPTSNEVTNAVTNVLKSQGLPMVSFHTGLISDRADESPRDPRYRLLEKAGIIKVSESKGSGTEVSLTPKGRGILNQISGVRRSVEADANVAYAVPLAAMQLVDISDIKMAGRGRAMVEFSWRWDPNVLGQSFDASTARIRAFTPEDRAALIDKHGARFYRQAPTKLVIAVIRTPRGWQLENE